MSKQILGVTLYTTQETATMLGVGVQTVRNLVKDEKLSGQRIGVEIHITEDSIKAFCKIQKEPQPCTY